MDVSSVILDRVSIHLPPSSMPWELPCVTWHFPSWYYYYSLTMMILIWATMKTCCRCDLVVDPQQKKMDLTPAEQAVDTRTFDYAFPHHNIHWSTDDDEDDGVV